MGRSRASSASVRSAERGAAPAAGSWILQLVPAIRDYLARIETSARGKIRTQLYESGQLFPDLQVGKALLQGQIEMAVPGSWSLTGIVPDADFLQLPILYGRSIELVHRAVDGRTSRPLNSYADLKGLKIRNNGGAGQAWRTQLMGAIPNTTPLPNVALGLSQGTFDGLITTNETIASGQFWESGIRHSLEDHQFLGEYIPIVSLAFWRKLSPDLQQVFTDVWGENIANYRANMAAAQFRARELVQARGIKIVVPSAGEIGAKRLEMMADQERVAKLSKISSEMVSAVSAELAVVD
jgi:TRAP-type transport system periplasmic protein